MLIFYEQWYFIIYFKTSLMLYCQRNIWTTFKWKTIQFKIWGLVCYKQFCEVDSRSILRPTKEMKKLMFYFFILKLYFTSKLEFISKSSSECWIYWMYCCINAQLGMLFCNWEIGKYNEAESSHLVILYKHNSSLLN